MKNKIARVWNSLWLWRIISAVVLLALYFGDPLPWPNPLDPDFGHGNYGVRDGKVFADLDHTLGEIVGLGRRFVINEDTMQIGVYNAPHFVLTLTNRQNQRDLLTGTGPSFHVADPQRTAQQFAVSMAAKGYTTRVVPGFLPKHPDKLYVVVVTDRRYPESEWWNQPLLGWQPAFRVRTTAMGLPTFRSFAEFGKESSSLFPTP